MTKKVLHARHGYSGINLIFMADEASLPTSEVDEQCDVGFDHMLNFICQYWPTAVPVFTIALEPFDLDVDSSLSLRMTTS